MKSSATEIQQPKAFEEAKRKSRGLNEFIAGRVSHKLGSNRNRFNVPDFALQLIQE